MIIKTSYPFMKPPPSARLIRGHRSAQGLVGAWTMAENGGLQVFDSLEYGNTGTLLGNTSWVLGKSGYVLDFPGAAGDYVEVPDSPILLFADSQITISIVARFDSFGSFNTLAHGSIGNNWTSAYWLCPRSASVMRWSINDDGANDFDPGITLGQWHHYIATYDNVRAKVWVDGVKKADFARTVNLTNTIGVRFGVIGTGSWLFNGQIDHVIMWNRALNASEIAELYWRPFGMFERRARTALMSGYEVVAPPVGMAGAMTTNTGYWGW